MSVNKLGIVLLSSFLIFATAPTAPAQNTQYPKGEKQTGTQQQGQAKQDQQRTTDKKATDKNATEKKDSTQATEKKATTKKAKTAKKTSGMSKETVREAQMALKNKGMDPGPIDGMMGPKTMSALREFQTQNHLQATGKLDERTQTALGVRTSRSTESSSLDSGRTREEQAQATEKTSQQESARYKPGTEVENGKVAGAETQSDTTKKTSDQGAYKHESDNSADPSQNTSRTYDAKSDKVDKDASDRIQKSAEVLQALTSAGDKGIPRDLLERAKAIAVVPHVVKGAFGIGGRYGKGVVAQRLPGGRWSAPSFLQIGGGSFGAQLGVSATDLVLVFTSAQALDLLMKGKDLKLGADASVAAGPIGRSAEAGVNANLETGVLAYSRSKGLFAGVALDGSVLDIDQDTNKKVYGPSVTAENILNGKVAANATVQPFMDTLGSSVPKQKVSQR